MEVKDITKKDILSSINLYEPSNYSFIFKKTEKVVCAVFYITDIEKDISDSNTKDNRDIIYYVRDVAREALDHVLTVLTSGRAALRSDLVTLSIRGLVRLQSALRVSAASGAISGEYVDVLGREIDDILRNIALFSEKDARSNTLQLDTEKEYLQATREQRVRSIRRERAAPRALPGVVGNSRESAAEKKPDHQGRREMIVSVLRSKGQASIKDIADVITDCSEKTIQRELITMIGEGKIVRKGERRWSTYSLVS